ncbi:MAG: hypothetical protein ABIO72_04400 [Patescibacteria group bacterium]
MENPFLPPPQEYKPPRVDTQDRAKEIYVSTDVFTYLEDTGREKLCRDMFHCDKWKVEPVLLEELAQEQDEKKRNKIRGLIRAVSNFPPDHRSLPEMLHGVGSDIRLHDERWEEIEASLLHNELGQNAEYAVTLMEQRYNVLMARWSANEEGPIKDALGTEIERLRPIRDQLYLRLVHPAFARKMLFTETIDRTGSAQPAATA